MQRLQCATYHYIRAKGAARLLLAKIVTLRFVPDGANVLMIELLIIELL